MSQTVHILAIVTGALTIFATAGPSLGLPVQVGAAVGVVVAVLTYVANQLPALGTS